MTQPKIVGREFVTVARGEEVSHLIVLGIDRLVVRTDSNNRNVGAVTLGEGKYFGMHRDKPPALGKDKRLHYAGILTFKVDEGTPNERKKQLFVRASDAKRVDSIIVLVEHADVLCLEGSASILECGEHALLVIGPGGAVRCADRTTRNEFIVEFDDVSPRVLRQRVAAEVAPVN